MSETASILKSFIDPGYLAARIEHEYGLPGVQCQLIKATMRDIYDVQCATQGQRFIAALYPWQLESEAHIYAEIKIIEHVYASGIATARALQRRNGDRLVPIELPEGPRYLVLFE